MDIPKGTVCPIGPQGASGKQKEKEPIFRTIDKIHNHISAVQEMMLTIVEELNLRGMAHDSSKFEPDELVGYMRFEELPKGLEYGSEEYKAAMAKITKDNDAISLHYQRNPHHPEFHDSVSDMTLLDIIEMVCDWAGAHVSYGNAGDWENSIEKNIAKYEFTDGQKWVIMEISQLLKNELTELH